MVLHVHREFVENGQWTRESVYVPKDKTRIVERVRRKRRLPFGRLSAAGAMKWGPGMSKLLAALA